MSDHPNPPDRPGQAGRLAEPAQPAQPARLAQPAQPARSEPPVDMAPAPAPAGLLARLAGSLKARFGAGGAAAAPSAEAAASAGPADEAAGYPLLRAHAAKLCSAAAAVRAVRPGDHVFVGTACATPRTLVAALETLAVADVELLHFLTDMPSRTTPRAWPARSTATAASSSARICAPPCARAWPITCRCRWRACRG